MKRTGIIILVLALGLTLASFKTGFCSYHPLLLQSQVYQDGFMVWDHSRHIECSVGIGPSLIYIPLGGAK